MASLHDQAATVKSAIASVATCTPAVTVLLKDLLLPRDSDAHSALSKDSKSAKSSRTTARSKQNGSTAGSTRGGDRPELSAKEKALLATHVINATLKSLGDAAKKSPPPPPPSTPKKPPTAGDEDLASTTTAPRRIRRSISEPMTPMQPRCLNRVSTSPEAIRKLAKPSVPPNSTECLSTVECARVAFSALRALQTAGKIMLPELQLESGMLSLVGKLTSLGLMEHALKELRVLKRRLTELMDGDKKTAKTISNAQSLAEILDFRATNTSGQILALTTATQVQTLRIMSTLKRPKDIESALPLLRGTNKSSVLNLLLLSAQSSEAEKSKAARQLESVSQLLLALTPSISSCDDEAASESRLSIDPVSALELQLIALKTRLCWWKLAKHRADVDKDLLSPLSKCLSTCMRRTQKSGTHSYYELCLNAFNDIRHSISEQNLQPSKSSKSPLASTYQILGKLARESGHHADAVSWIEELNQMIDRGRDSATKCFATSAFLLAHRLRMAWKYPSQEPLLKEVLEGLGGSLRGDSAELEDLLDGLSMVRKVATQLLVGNVADDGGQVFDPPADLRELLEAFILQMPRFCLRWLGKQPSSTSNTKDFLRYEHRRTVLGGSAHLVLDSALMLAKNGIEEKRSAWDKLDSLLQDCVNLLDNLGSLASSEHSSHSYAKISHLYYMQFTNLIAAEPKPTKNGTTFPYALKALRRSVDCVKHRPTKEREKAQVLYKLERLSELYNLAGKAAHALDALQTLRRILIEDGALTAVAQALRAMPPRTAWAINHNAQSLAWSLQTIAKMEKDKVWIDWTFHLDEPERVAALEYSLDCLIAKKSTGTDLLDPAVQAFLQQCSVARYPVRRLRTLLRLLIANIGNEDQLQMIQAEIEEVLLVDEHAELGDDGGLRGCLAHMKALSRSTTALARAPLDYGELEKSIATWRAILDGSDKAADLDQRIDDVPGLLEHLQSVADYARLSNQNSLLLKALQLAAALGCKSGTVDATLNLQISAALALQLTNVGHSEKAAAIFEQAQQLRCDSREETVRFLLSYAEHLIEIGNVEKADGILHQAKAAGSRIQISSRSRVHKLMMGQTSVLYSAVALGRGDTPWALTHARNAARVLFQEWARLEQQAAKASPEKSTASADVSTAKLDVSLTEATENTKSATPKVSGPEAWKLAHPVFRGLLFLSNIYMHLGMYQECVCYADQAQKLAQAAESEAYLAECEGWRSFISARAGKHEDALKSIREATSRLDGSDFSSKLVSLYCRFSNIYREARDYESEKSMLESAEAMVERMAGSLDIGPDTTTDVVMAVEEAKATLRTTATTTRKTRIPASKSVTTRTVPKKPSKTTKTQPNVMAMKVEIQDSHLHSIKAAVLVEKASSMLHRKDWTGAWQLLQETRLSSNLTSNLLCELIATARSLLGQSMDQMSQDAVYSVIQESTLSFPSANGASMLDKFDRFSLVKASPPRKLAVSPPPQDAPSQGYLDNLREARHYLLEAHSLASVLGDGKEVHRILGMLQTVVILLSAASASSRKAGILGHPGYATCAVEMARNLTWRREYKALQAEKSSGRSGLEWPEELKSAETRRTSLSPVVDMTKFQRKFIDIIPQEWSVVSISLSDNNHDLCISKLRAGQSPFVIRLPLERATSRDADSEVFNFQQGRTELMDIIKRANSTCHDKRDFSVKGAKTAWWAERNALDVQLRELLEKIESVWLGGFKGIFSQQRLHPELLSRFQTSFQTILDKYLPSRRQVRGKKTARSGTSRVALDTRILELFIGLGDASAEDCDFDEMLNDLLYFVVDILQFHGERNAYDEIDFDTMVVETMDALHCYHADAKDVDAAGSRGHTILVLDKALHTFPWESMPCLDELAVSRVPSLACLRRLILEQRPSSHSTSETDNASQEGHHVSIDNGTCILNPGGDLKTTQAFFETPLSASLGSSWQTIQGKPPTEGEFEETLASSDILLYMGHGGGAQYIRNRQIRRLEKCRATALLMGCSSASLTDVGDFELYGLIWSYMLAGCPAVVGTLWDVTDRDIDLYTGRLYEEWGLVKRGAFQATETKAKGKSKEKIAASGNEGGHTATTTKRSASRKRAVAAAEQQQDGECDSDTACEYGDASLPEAVTRARNAGVCKLKYLNAAAVCVYGIPVYVDRQRSGRET